MRRRTTRGPQDDAPSLAIVCECGRTVQGRPWLAGTDTAGVVGMFVVRWHYHPDSAGSRCPMHGIVYLPDQSAEVLAAAAAIRRPEPKGPRP